MNDTLNRLLGALHRVFDRDPQADLALRIAHNGYRLRWTIANERLVTRVDGGTGGPFDIDLTGHTIASLAALIAGLEGYSIPYLSETYSGWSARSLIAGSGDDALSNGDHLRVWRAPLWSLLMPQAAALHTAAEDIAAAVNEIHFNRAAGEYLDVHGDYYGIARMTDADAEYLRRIIARILIARSNNVAIQLALAAEIGCLDSAIRVEDANVQSEMAFHNGVFFHNDSLVHSGRVGRGALDAYPAQFDVYILPEVPVTAEQLHATIRTFKAAGTHLRDIYHGEPLVHNGHARYDGREIHNQRLL